MELSFDQIKPYLSERGQLEVELAAQRALLDIQGQTIAELQAAATEGASDG